MWDRNVQFVNNKCNQRKQTNFVCIYFVCYFRKLLNWQNFFHRVFLYACRFNDTEYSNKYVFYITFLRRKSGWIKSCFSLYYYYSIVKICFLKYAYKINKLFFSILFIQLISIYLCILWIDVMLETWKEKKMVMQHFDKTVI